MLWGKLIPKDYALVFFYDITDHDKLGDIPNLLTYNFHESKVQHISNRSSAQVHIKLKSRCRPTTFLFGSATARKRSTSNLPWVARRIRGKKVEKNSCGCKI